jgi:predicted O-methyltransferase YrrM
MLYLCRAGFKNSHILEGQEIPVKEKRVTHKITFGTFPSPHTCPQRKLWAESFLDEKDAAIIFMVRDPRDVFLSDHGLNPGQPWVGDPQIWIDNAILLQNLENHPRVIPVKFEELLTKANEVQEKVAQALDLEMAVPFSECWKYFGLPSHNNLMSLKGVRPLDSSRIGNWKNDLGKRNYLVSKLQSKPDILALMKHFEYSSPELANGKSHLKRTIPWLTENAISFLGNFFKKNPHAKVLEFGCGGSSIWMSKFTKNLTSVEHDEAWFTKIKTYIEGCDACYSIDFKMLPRPYNEVCEKFPDEYFDLVLVDGRDRVKCVESCVRVLKRGGVLILDNAERTRYEKVYSILDGWEFTSSVQEKPDSLGFYYPNWQTNWWIKPGKTSSAIYDRLISQIFVENPYNNFDFKKYPMDLQGWNGKHKVFAQTISRINPKIIIEVGVWKGQATIHMAEIATKINPETIIIPVDTWLGSPEHWNPNRPDKIFWSLQLKHGYPSLYYQFLANVMWKGLEKNILPLPQTSINAAIILKRLGITADIIHIDAGHDFENVYSDLVHYWDLLTEGGVLIGDDFTRQGVKSAAEHFCSELNLELVTDSPKYLISKNKLK